MKNSILKTNDLTVTFGGLKALNGFDFELKRGEFVGLIGPNGSGKTTFFNALTGIYPPAEGFVKLNGDDITRAAPKKIYQYGITRTFQRLRLSMPLSVFDNLVVGNQRHLNLSLWGNIFARKKFREKVMDQTIVCKKLLNRFSKGLEQKLYEPVSSLPMIDRRRVEVCRALISEPKVLLLDEPSAGMTPDETRALMNDLQEWREQYPDLAIILIEHEMDLISRVSERCVVLNYGEKIAEGTYEQVAKDRAVRKAYLGED